MSIIFSYKIVVPLMMTGYFHSADKVAVNQSAVVFSNGSLSLTHVCKSKNICFCLNSLVYLNKRGESEYFSIPFSVINGLICFAFP